MNERKFSSLKDDQDHNNDYQLLSDNHQSKEIKSDYVRLHDPVEDQPLKRDSLTYWIPEDSYDSKLVNPISLANHHWVLGRKEIYPYHLIFHTDRYTNAALYYTSKPTEYLIVKSYACCDYNGKDNLKCECGDCCCTASIEFCDLLYCLGIKLPVSFIACLGGFCIDIVNCRQPLSPQDQSMDFDGMTAAVNFINDKKAKEFLELFNSSKAIREEFISLNRKINRDFLNAALELIITNDMKDFSHQQLKQFLLYVNQYGISILGKRQPNVEGNNLEFVKYFIQSRHPKSLEVLDFILEESKYKYVLLNARKKDIVDYFQYMRAQNTFPLKYCRQLAAILAKHGMVTVCHQAALLDEKNKQAMQHYFFKTINKNVIDLIADYAEEESVIRPSLASG